MRDDDSLRSRLACTRKEPAIQFGRRVRLAGTPRPSLPMPPTDACEAFKDKKVQVA